jgi:hypothetical protein
MPKPKGRWLDPGFILDAAQATVAITVAVVLALDMTDIWSGVPWLSSNLTSLTFIAVCILMTSSFLERRIGLEKLSRTTNHKLDYILSRQRGLCEQIREFTSRGVVFEDRLGFTVPFEKRFEDARQMDFLGLSLMGLASTYGSFLLKKAKSGCKLRFVVVDPGSQAVSTVVGFGLKEDAMFRKRDIEHAVQRLQPILETGNAELRFAPVAPPFSLVVTNPGELGGKVTVELYGYKVALSDRPHFVLAQDSNRIWYDHFKDQFDRLWRDSRPHEVPGGVSAHSPEASRDVDV